MLIQPSLYYQLEQGAKRERRSLNAYINMILENMIKEKIADDPAGAEVDNRNEEENISELDLKYGIANFLLFGRYGYGKNKEVAKRFIASNDQLLSKAIHCSNRGYHHVKGQPAVMGTAAPRAAIFEALKAGKDEHVISQLCYAANTGYSVGSAYFPAKNLRKFILSTGGKKKLDVANEKYDATLTTIDEVFSAVEGDSHV